MEALWRCLDTDFPAPAFTSPDLSTPLSHKWEAHDPLCSANPAAVTREPLKDDSRPAKTNVLGKHQKKRPGGKPLSVDTAGATEWTSWFNVDHPGGEGDYESLEAVRFYYRERVCTRPVSIQARTTEWELPEDVGEIVHYSPDKGFWCINREQPGGRTCSNYHVRFLCPVACQLSCAEGKVSKNCSSCTCQDHTLVGTVLSTEGAALANARVSLKAKPQAVLARTDRRGGFSIRGVCAGSGANVSVQLETFAPGEAPIVSNGSRTSSVQVTLQRLEKPYMVKHPESKIFLGKEKIGFTSYKGTFAIDVPPDTRRLVVRFVDRLQKFVDTVKVLPFDPRGGAIYQDIKVMRKKEPVDLDPTQANTILLGELEGQEPVGEMVIPAGSFLRPDGEVYNGTVKASVTFLDPRDVTTVAAASSDLNFINAEGDLVPLRTYGMFSVDFRESESNQVLRTGRVEVRVDAEQIRMPEHLQKMKLWSLNPETGLWEEEGAFRRAKERRGKREERAFLIGNVEIRERRLFNLDVPESRRCFVKVRAYVNEKFIPSEQLEGVVVTLINLEPEPGYSSNPRAWGRFDSVLTGPNGACLPAFCDGQRADAYTAYVTATMGGEELEALPSSPKLNPNAVGVSQPYLNKLGYRRTDHDDPSLKKTAFKINLAKPNSNNIDEVNGPIYAYRSLRECEEAPVADNHFRFYRVEVDKYEYNVVPFKESDVASWTGDYLSWWPNPQEFRACYIKVKISGPQEYMVRSRSVGGSHPRTRGRLYGLRDTRSVRDLEIYNSSAACVEFKCSGMLFDQSLIDRTLVSIVPQGSCRRTAINSLLRAYLGRHPPVVENNDTTVFNMLAPVDPLGHNYGIYTVTDQNPRLAKEIAIGRCFDGTSDGFSREMKSDMGTAMTFYCQEKPVTHQSFFQRLLSSPTDTLTEIRREMRGNEQLRAPSQVVAYPAGLRTGVSTQTRRTPSSRRRMGLIRAQQ
ncbi:Cartilage intermediate layer protein 2 [Chelonia mydas]|uniref:Cartilage intermediate layer protein 2 n=1 Tax=Chelonia mydas TaxID=8469 RepID=M7AGQ2_CHEMY|nr:Cartilage intermediate layer protein 2 [Chelonia mydas]